MKKLSLIQRFSIISLVAMIIVSLAFGYLINEIVIRDMFRYSIREAKLIIHENFIKHFTPSHLQNPRNGPDYDEFTHQIHHILLGPYIRKLKVWNKDMVVVWFNDRNLVGRQFIHKKELKRALAGEEVWSIKSPTKINEEYKHTIDLKKY
jgi:hypothetical protein